MTKEEKCTVLITGKFKEGGNQTDEFKEYSERTNANGVNYGGVILSKFMVEQNLGYGITPHVVVVAQYPSKEKAIACFTNEEYKSIIPLRDVAFEDVNILITNQ